MTTTSNLTTTYSLHTEEDLIALVLHQFGYWPQESLVLLSVTKHAVGPCIRVNLPDEQQDLEQYFDKMVEEGFLAKEDREKTLFTDSVAEMNEFITNYNK